MPTWGTKGLPSGPRANHQGVGLVARHTAPRVTSSSRDGSGLARDARDLRGARGLEFWCNGECQLGTKGLPSGPRANHQGVGLVTRHTHHASRARHVTAVGGLVTRVICVCAKGLEFWCKGPRDLVQGASSFGAWKMPTWGPKGLPSGPRANNQGGALVAHHTHHASSSHAARVFRQSHDWARGLCSSGSFRGKWAVQ